MTQKPGQFSTSKPAGAFQRPKRLPWLDDDAAPDPRAERARRRERVIEMRRDGRSLRSIAAELNVSRETIRTDLVSVNLTPRPPRRPVIFERVTSTPPGVLYVDATGNLFSDPERHCPLGLVVGRPKRQD